MTSPDTEPATAVTFAVLEIAPEPYAVTPILTARIGVAAIGDDPVHAIALRCQVRIEPLRRDYTDPEAAGLLDLFGPRERWSSTQRNFLWQHGAAMVPGFVDTTQVDLALDCTYDFEVAASKYLHAAARRNDTAAIPVQWNRFHPGHRAASRCSRCRGIARTISSFRSRCGRTSWHNTSRTPVGCGCDATPSAQLTAYKTQRALLSYDEAIASLMACEEIR